MESKSSETYSCCKELSGACQGVRDLYKGSRCREQWWEGEYRRCMNEGLLSASNFSSSVLGQGKQGCIAQFLSPYL